MKNTVQACLAGIALAGLVVGSPDLAVADPDQAEHRFGFKQENILEIVARHDMGADEHLVFDLSAHEIPSGWTTIKQVNDTGVIHFVFLIRVPDEQSDITLDEYFVGMPTAFQEAWNPFFAGEVDIDGFFALLGPNVPPWFGGVRASGGPGFIDVFRTGWTTQYLLPGTYIVECYVLDGDGIFHNMSGMIDRLVVTEQANELPEPEADLTVSISSTEGIVFDADNVQPGLHTVAVHFEDNVRYGHMLGHDVHLIRFDDDTTVEDVNVWMNYLDVGPDGFYADRGALVSTYRNPGPGTFLGGVQSMFAVEEAGQDYPITAYIHANLTPGRYAWVAEVPNPIAPFPDNPEISMLVEFDVTPYMDLAGAWYDPETDGQGWNFVSAENGLFGYFYGFGESGGPLWLMTADPLTEIRPGEPVTWDLLFSETGSFQQPTHPDLLDYWGEATVTFEDCERAQVELTGLDGSQTQTLERLTRTPGQAGCSF